MNPNLTANTMADEIARGQLDAKAARGHLVAEAVAPKPSVSCPARSRRRRQHSTAGAVFFQVGTFIHGSANDIRATRPVTPEEAY